MSVVEVENVSACLWIGVGDPVKFGPHCGRDPRCGLGPCPVMSGTLTYDGCVQDGVLKP
jgi:hypothetical protein